LQQKTRTIAHDEGEVIASIGWGAILATFRCTSLYLRMGRRIKKAVRIVMMDPGRKLIPIAGHTADNEVFFR
jgi:hypothetical protein